MTEPASPASTERLRRQNASLVLRSLRRLGPGSRSELAQRTGLAKATVGTIVGELEALHAVAEEPARPGSRGRPGRPVALAGERYVALGLELNVDYVAAVVLDLAGGTVAHEVRPVGDAAPLEALVALVADTARPIEDRVLVGSVVAVPGLVRGDDRTVDWAPNVDIDGEVVAERVAAVLGRGPVHVANDADCAAYAEAHHGAATDTASLLYLTGTVGVGAGIVDGGELVRGGSGFAGEVGHMPIGDPAAVCGCGRRGCWETAVGLHAMLRAVEEPEVGTPLASAEAVALRARDDDEVRAGLARLGRDLGRGLAVLCEVLDPAVVVLGGYFVPLGDLVLDPARATLAERVLGPRQGPELRVGTLGIEAAALGAAERAFAGVFAGEVELAP
ncbi:ROK family protein [Nocardioides anomalus]|uniref:ROK family protein n=1 Tax=Nocardioides anomalus TaxID=2712223 RepID=A0A6G6W9Q9_9ACTN|nr:ROK family protein [Nocardioides anomalus]QIG41887.1 ROK family protein [Nocardioides anomalus]